MLRQRVVTALVLAPLAIAGVLLLPNGWFALALAGIFLLAAHEWAGFAGFSSKGQHVAFIVIMAAALVGLWLLFDSGVSAIPLLIFAALWWLLNGLRLVRIRQIKPVSDVDPRAALSGLLALSSAWIGLVSIHDMPKGPYLLLSLLLLIWIADIGAYFAGRRWGGRKLAPQISPGKTWAGVYGALAGAAVWSVALGLLLDLSWQWMPGFMALCLSVVAISIIGDLYESKLKRQRGLKDSGRLLPGHGGVMDRIDSLSAAIPLFALGLTWFGIGA